MILDWIAGALVAILLVLLVVALIVGAFLFYVLLKDIVRMRR